MKNKTNQLRKLSKKDWSLILSEWPKYPKNPHAWSCD